MFMINRPKYSEFELKRALSDVFASVYFINKLAKKKIQDSYFLNFDNLIAYARENGIDEMQYIRSIQRDLLTLPHTYLARASYKRYELKRALTNVFDSVWFDDKGAKLSMQDSYFLNFDSFVDYANRHKIDPMEHINGIRNMLLELPGCHPKDRIYE